MSLAQAPDRRRELGERAYYFGCEHRDKAIYSARLWQALSEAAAFTPPAKPKRNPQDGILVLARDTVFALLNALRILKLAVAKIVRGEVLERFDDE